MSMVQVGPQVTNQGVFETFVRFNALIMTRQGGYKVSPVAIQRDLGTYLACFEPTPRESLRMRLEGLFRFWSPLGEHFFF